MDCELVNQSQSDEKSGDGESRSPVTNADRFVELFPSYLAMGMTPEQYWDGDPMLAKYYCKAEEIRNEKRNQELWLQGMYLYDAMLCVSPILHAFAKKGTKPKPYPTQPYALTKRERRKEKKERERAMYEKGKRYMEALTSSINKKFQKAKETP